MSMKSTEQYLKEIEDRLYDKIVMMKWEEDERFETLREMQKYNKGINDAIEIVSEVLNSDEFKSPLLRQLLREVEKESINESDIQ